MVLQYGTELLLDSVIKIILYLVLGGILGKTKETLFALLTWCVIRKQTGGRHVKNNFVLELWKAFEQQGYKTELISKRKDVSLVSKAISFPDIKNENKIEIIKEYNNFFEKIEKNNKKEIIIVEIPGNLLEISKKIYGDFGMTAYFMMRIMPPDFVICNIPYMEYIIENLEVLSETVKNTINIPIDIYNMNPVYFDLLASEQMENFEYVLLSDKYIDQIVGKSNIYNICTKERINKIIEKIITQLKGYII